MHMRAARQAEDGDIQPV